MLSFYPLVFSPSLPINNHPMFTIPFTLSSLSQIRFTYSIIPNLLNICLHHRDHHIDLHPVSIKHSLPISDTKFSSNTTLNIYFTISFVCLSSKVLHPVSSNQFISNISRIPKLSTQSILPYSQSMHRH